MAGQKKAVARQEKQQFWGARLTEAPEMRNVAYCAGRDVAPRPMADEALVPYDIWQNKAHVCMLERTGIIAGPVTRDILSALDAFERSVMCGAYSLDPRKEDVHTNIEHFVAARIGAGKSGVMHTARSRNDQTTTVVRMYVRDRLMELADGVAQLIASILPRATENADTVLTGFTHYQPACITTLGHWFASYAQFLLRDLERIGASYDRLNVSPLGAAAAFGTSWPIDRAMTAHFMGFSAVQENSLDCVTNRWEMEADAASAAAFVMTHLSIIAQDLIVLSMPQVAIIRVADRYVTGSSIMPQKRNPDFAEVTRAKAAVVQNLMSSLFGVAKGVLSGYNRDTQWTKYLVMDLFAEACDAPSVFGGVFDTLSVDRAAARESARKWFVDAVDVADVLAQEAKIPFRKAYEIVSKAVKVDDAKGYLDAATVEKLAAESGVVGVSLRMAQPEDIVGRKAHPGGPAPAAVRSSIKTMEKRLAKLVAAQQARREALAIGRGELAEAERQIAGVRRR